VGERSAMSGAGEAAGVRWESFRRVAAASNMVVWGGGGVCAGHMEKKCRGKQ
jgi:hypothetical protein